MNQTQESYQKAVGSDALLKEALDELKDAYENSIEIRKLWKYQIS